MPTTLKGCPVLVTAGPTREFFDPVRFLSNPSSGKMGYALAQACLEAGAQVSLISGPVSLPAPAGVEFVPVVSALDMLGAVQARFQACKVLIACAAVSDFRPESASSLKIKKQGQPLVLRLVPNPDILASMAKIKGNRVLVGFAAETDHLEEHAAAKLEAKNLDLLVANDITRPGAGFASDTNIATLCFPGKPPQHLAQMTKKDLAARIAAEIEKILAQAETLLAKGEKEE